MCAQTAFNKIISGDSCLKVIYASANAELNTGEIVETKPFKGIESMSMVKPNSTRKKKLFQKKLFRLL